MSDNPTSEELAAAAVSRGTSLGMAAIEAHVECTTTHTVTWDSAAVLSAVSLPAQRRGRLWIRAYAGDGRVVAVNGAAQTISATHALVAKAQAQLVDAPRTPFAGPPERYEQTGTGLGVFDRRQATIEDEDREEAVNENIEDVRSVEGAVPMSFRYSEVLRDRAVHASIGPQGTEQSTHYTMTGKVSNGTHAIEQSVQSRLFADVASLPLGADLAKQVLRYRDPADLRSEALPVVLAPRVIARIMEAVLPAFDRRLIDDGKSFLTDGRRIGSEKLHAIDDARMPGGFCSRAFDARGVPSLDLPLIREGVVGALYQDTELSRELNSRPSGHEGPDGCWPGNLVMRAGTRSRNMIFPDLGPFLLLDALEVSGKWFDLQTGKLRLKGHFLAGTSSDDLQYVGLHKINTNFVDLWSGIQEVANDQQRFGAVDVSTWVVDGLKVG